jgi:Zn-dependent M28 family amino/carboxypeptidase
VRCSSVVECVRPAAPEDGQLGSKHVVPNMLINDCCIDGRIGIYIDLFFICIILDRHTSYNINDLNVPSSVTNI